ncbi:LytR/AlgR family response regulator transcription factor [Labilibacter marinus]|uniref:LytR/AlgR family response regulator transcription factor n=1 Tax=Labilibacter marinus TaxID=1477105 RepID=UPI00095022DB|nr:LytTR family DNA-binding domain-containing protein [Labilibacter marinus]
MTVKSSNPYYHIIYWFLVLITITLVFGSSWGNSMAAFYFVCMLLPIVLGTSYFFNYILVPRFFIPKKYLKFSLYTFYTMVCSLYLESIVIMFAYVYLGNYSFKGFPPNASDTVLLAVILYLLVFIGSVLLMIKQIKESQALVKALLEEKEKMKTAVLEIKSNRKLLKIPYDEIIYIESLSDYIKINTTNGAFTSKEKISKLNESLPDMFIRIHRSYIINKSKILSHSYSEVEVGVFTLTIGRSYRTDVKQQLTEM